MKSLKERERSVGEMDSEIAIDALARWGGRAIFHGLGEGSLEISPTRLPRKAGSSGGKRNNANVISVDDRTNVRATVGEKRATGSLPLRTPFSRANRIRHPVPRMTFPSVPPGARCVHGVRFCGPPF